MKTTDFEDAIIKMDSRIVLDEVKLNKGHVRRFHGHIGTTLIMWDEKGKGYTCRLDTVREPEEIDHETHESVTESFYVRDTKFDIHFDNIKI